MARGYRTDAQKIADNTDMHLFRMIGEAEQMAKETKAPNWRNLVEALRRARYLTRLEMHREDAAATPN